MPKDELPLDPNSPAPFKRPLLVLQLGPKQIDETWFVDVDGKIDLYIKDAHEVEEGGHQNNNATPLMKELAKNLRLKGVMVYRIRMYAGSGGPSHILRHGAIFERMSFLASDGSSLPTWMDE